MPKLRYSAEELLADHPYAKPHVEAGYKLHGGFDSAGHYVSPRTLNRWPAIRAWSEALKARGGELIDSSQQLMVRGHFPTEAQQKLLLEQGLGETLWDSLTVTGVIEARGRRLATAEAPDFQSIIVEDISDTATGHLNKGLLKAEIPTKRKAGTMPCGLPCATSCSARTPIPFRKFPKLCRGPRWAG
jgi:hypothetical protein